MQAGFCSKQISEVLNIVAMVRKKNAGFTGDTVDLDGVTLRYDAGRDVLNSVSLKLPQKSFYFLTGPSGAGKTSLLSLLYPHGHPTYEGEHQHLKVISALRAKDEAALREAFEQDLIEGGRKFIENLTDIESRQAAESEPAPRSRR